MHVTATGELLLRGHRVQLGHFHIPLIEGDRRLDRQRRGRQRRHFGSYAVGRARGDGPPLDQLGRQFIERGTRGGVRLDLLTLQFVHGPVVNPGLVIPGLVISCAGVVTGVGTGRRVGASCRAGGSPGIGGGCETVGLARAGQRADAAGAGRCAGFGVCRCVVVGAGARNQIGQRDRDTGGRIDQQQLFLDTERPHSRPSATARP